MKQWGTVGPPPDHWKGLVPPDQPTGYKKLLSGGHAYVTSCPGCAAIDYAPHLGYGDPLYGFADCLRCAVRLARRDRAQSS